MISIPETGKDDTIVGTVKAPKDGFVFIAIPYEAGWSVTVDGAPAERWKGCEGFTTFKVPAGEHEFRMHYLVPGLKKGILLSVFSVILFVLFSFIGKKRGDTEPLAFVLSFVKRRRES
ncbi:MAG: YfhO family protein [Lachnospiraceae bacterium]|nr:YfhO family protein [Lachnospiraceae bacterium]